MHLESTLMNEAALFHSHPSILARFSCKQCLCGLRSQNPVQSAVGPRPRGVEGWGWVGWGGWVGGGSSVTVCFCLRLCCVAQDCARWYLPLRGFPCMHLRSSSDNTVALESKSASCLFQILIWSYPNFVWLLHTRVTSYTVCFLTLACVLKNIILWVILKVKFLVFLGTV